MSVRIYLVKPISINIDEKADTIVVKGSNGEVFDIDLKEDTKLIISKSKTGPSFFFDIELGEMK